MTSSGNNSSYFSCCIDYIYTNHSTDYKEEKVTDDGRDKTDFFYTSAWFDKEVRKAIFINWSRPFWRVMGKILLASSSVPGCRVWSPQTLAWSVTTENVEYARILVPKSSKICSTYIVAYVVFWIVLQINKMQFRSWNLTEVPALKDNGELIVSCINLVHRQKVCLMPPVHTKW